MLSLTGGPLIIGATGGSGTRAVARLLCSTQTAYLGDNLNAALDCLDFKEFYDHYVPAAIVNWLGESVEVDDWTRFEKCFEASLQIYKEGYRNKQMQAPLWGWKGPRSMYFLPFFYEIFTDLRFIHIVRDGRDIAYSQNQNQLNLYGNLMLGDEYDHFPESVRSIALWSRINVLVSRFGRSHLGSRYFCLKYEDLVFDKSNALNRLEDFLGVSNRFDSAARDRLIASIGCGRWRSKEDAEINNVRNAGAHGLHYFEYLSD